MAVRRTPAGGARRRPFLVGGVLLGAVLVSTLLAQPAAADIKRWVDEQGQVHYGDRPPDVPVGSSVEDVRVQVPGGVGASREELAERQRAWREQQILDKEAAEKNAAQAEEAQLRVRQCQAARNRLSTLENAGRIFQYDEQGRQVWLGDDERAQEKIKVQQQIRELCD